MENLNLLDRAQLFIKKLDETDFGIYVTFSLDPSSTCDYVMIHIHLFNGVYGPLFYTTILDLLYEYFRVDKSINEMFINSDTNVISIGRV